MGTDFSGVILIGLREKQVDSQTYLLLRNEEVVYNWAEDNNIKMPELHYDWRFSTPTDPDYYDSWQITKTSDKNE